MLLKNKIKTIPRRLICDDRGWFLKVIDGKEDNLPKQTGEIYITNARKGQAKGGHYHINASEWFTLLTGSCDLLLVDIETNEKMVIKLCDKESKTIYVPKGIAHLFVNTDKADFLLLAYTDLLYDPEDTIPYNFSNI
jgi:dTDP-4-dehydrorhamnose 3,5-epimerase-like enzyme